MTCDNIVWQLKIIKKTYQKLLKAPELSFGRTGGVTGGEMATVAYVSSK